MLKSKHWLVHFRLSFCFTILVNKVLDATKCIIFDLEVDRVPKF